eukprot:8580864-Ditylum_brightwellii.AAC.1
MISLYGVWYFWGKEWWDPSKGGTTHLFAGFPYSHQVEPGMACCVPPLYFLAKNLLRLSFNLP